MSNRPPISLDEARDIHKTEKVGPDEAHLFELVQLANDIAARHGLCPRELMQEWAQAEYERLNSVVEA